MNASTWLLASTVVSFLLGVWAGMGWCEHERDRLEREIAELRQALEKFRR